MNYLALYTTLIIIVKVIFLFLAIYERHLERTQPKNNSLVNKISIYKERADFIFVAMMSLLLIFLFNPRENNILLINKETKMLIFLFGVILIITANWKLFIHETPFIVNVQHYVGAP